MASTPGYSVGIRLVQWDVTTLFLSTLLTEAILLIQIYAMYETNRKILVFMLLCCTATSACSSWIMSQDIDTAKLATVISIPSGLTCTFPSLPPRAYSFGIPFAVYDSLLCAFAVYRGYQSFTLSVGGHGNLANRLLRIMIRDSSILAYLSGMLVWVALSNAYTQIPGTFIIALSNVLSNRMILNIRDTASKQIDGSTNPSSNVTELSTKFPSATCCENEVDTLPPAGDDDVRNRRIV
ncbi:hypothetical protein CPC08DRAFT_764067 [Agrocybe pediades]|nr:hypothetical protein CPC08DRAFT_764067 [Agrocybe pediades]